MAATEANGVFHPKDRVYIYSRDDSGRRTHSLRSQLDRAIGTKNAIKKACVFASSDRTVRDCANNRFGYAERRNNAYPHRNILTRLLVKTVRFKTVHPV